jgi:hypothetical protein
MRPVNTYRTGLGRGAKPNGRPVQGNSPDDRIPRGPGCNRLKSVCADFFPACSFARPTILRALRTRFCRHPGIYLVRCGFKVKTKPWGEAVPPPAGRPRAQVQRTCREDHAPSHRPQMSSGRLFLDRVARQQSPSPLHRQPELTMHFSPTWAQGDISTLQKRGHFYFALTVGWAPWPAAPVCDRPDARVDRTARGSRPPVPGCGT